MSIPPGTYDPTSVDQTSLLPDTSGMRLFLVAVRITKQVSTGVTNGRVCARLEFGPSEDEVRGRVAGEYLADDWTIEILELGEVSDATIIRAHGMIEGRPPSDGAGYCTASTTDLSQASGRTPK